MSTKKNLLLCLDAFGTIFTPRDSLAAQYGGVARSFGVKINDDLAGKAFIKAYKDESKAHPNFGRAVGLGARKWWTNVIHRTFEPHHEGALPKELAPTLIDRFNSKDAYEVYPDVFAYLQQLAKSPHRVAGSTNRIVVGVITNSDDRVPDVLCSLGLRVNHLRYGSTASTGHVGEMEDEVKDIDFAIMSYDVGFEKPHRRIFDAATDVLKSMLTAEGQKDTSLKNWDLVYVGDEMEKDARGSTEAGWNAIYVDRSNYDGGKETPGVSYKTRIGDKEVDVLSDFTAMKNLRAQYPLIVE